MLHRLLRERGFEVRFPVSFGLLLVVIVVSTSLSVIWSVAHMILVFIDVGLIIGLRAVCHWETDA